MKKCSLALYLCKHVLSLEVLTLVILRGIRRNLRVVFICFSLMTKDVVYFFKCFLVIEGLEEDRDSTGRPTES